MCGIGGILTPSPGDVSEQGLQRMGQIMKDRGPDDEETYISEHVGLLHRRLSILDLSTNGNCPMPNEDGTVRVLLNGEIYNWRELREQLLAFGHTFRSTSDSEVITHGYEQWGVDIFRRLRGMFAIAIWDEPNSQLILARDRIGEKPLFYQRQDGQVRFASSILALNAYAQSLPDINADALVCYLSHTFIPSTHTVWQGVDVFPAAHFARIGVDGSWSLHKYWTFSRRGTQRMKISTAKLAMERVIDDSVRRCLDADVPVGVFLSGGVDSSLVAAVAARHHPNIQSFSLGFAEEEWSELPHARKVATHLGLRHEEKLLGLTETLQTLPNLVWHYGQPFGDSSSIATYAVSRLAREHVKVCLSGDGGDESFAGYWRTQSRVYAARYGALVPYQVRKHWVPVVAPLLGKIGKRLAVMNQLSVGRIGSTYANHETWHERLEGFVGEGLRPGLEHDRVACRVGHTSAHENVSDVQRLLYDDFQVQLPDDYLTKVDVASMAASLEVRAPLLDVGVLDSAWLLPDEVKIHLGTRKWLLKKIAADLVPPDVIYRKKMGFSLPLRRWFEGEMGQVLERLLGQENKHLPSFVDVAAVRGILGEHRQRVTDHSTRLWLILWLVLWIELVLTKQMSRDDDLNALLA